MIESFARMAFSIRDVPDYIDLMTDQTSNRSLLKVSGQDAQKFFQDLVTNDVTKLEQGLVYAALLTPQGKYLADFFLVPWHGAILIDVDQSLEASLIQRLTLYKLRADVTIEPMDLEISCGTGPKPTGAYDDPRNPNLGWRFYDTELLWDDTDWNALRVEHIIPQTGQELTPESYILEQGFERLNGVDFKKGCYVGQEVTARMKHKTELRKGLARVTLSGDAKPGDEITSNGRAVGVLHTRSGDHALAYLRFDRADGDMTAGKARVTR